MTNKKQPYEQLNQSTMEKQKRHTRLQKQIDGVTKAQEENKKACIDKNVIMKEMNEYAAYLQAKQDEANRKKQQKKDAEKKVLIVDNKSETLIDFF